MGKISTITQKSQIKTELKRNQMKACMIYLSIYLKIFYSLTVMLVVECATQLLQRTSFPSSHITNTQIHISWLLPFYCKVLQGNEEFLNIPKKIIDIGLMYVISHDSLT